MAWPVCQVQIETTSGRSLRQHRARISVVPRRDRERGVLLGHGRLLQVGQAHDLVAATIQVATNVIAGNPAAADHADT